MSLTSELLERYFEVFNYTDELNLDLDRIEKIETDAFKHCRHRRIRSLRLPLLKDLKCFSLSKKNTALFEPLKERLEELYLVCSLDCQFNFLEHLTNLKKLSLNGSSFNNAKPMFKGVNNQLIHLDLKDSNLTISDKTMFNDLKCLKYLDLSGVKLDQNVLPDLFKEIKQLESLTLLKTKFKPADDSFIHLENLKKLLIYGIEIPGECSNMLAPVKRLERLAMGGTATLNHSALMQLKNLKALKLFLISPIEIDQNYFQGLGNLEHLDLSDLNIHLTFSEINICNIDLKALANLKKSLESLNLSNKNLHIEPDCEIFSLENLENLNLSLSNRHRFMERELKLNETTFERMKKLKCLNLSGNYIKLEGNCFKHLTDLKELDLSHTILDSDNNDFDIYSSLKLLEKFKFDGIEPCASFQLYRLSELVNLRGLLIHEITEHDLNQFREMLRSQMKPGEEVEPNPTYDDLCFFILRDMTKLTSLKLHDCQLTCINKRVLSQMKELSFLEIAGNSIEHIPDDTFDCLTNLETLNLKMSHLKQINLNRLCFKLDKLKNVTLGNSACVDLMDERFNFKSLFKLECDKFDHLEMFYHSRRAYLQQIQQNKAASSSSSFATEVESIEIMLQTIDAKLDQIKSEKDKSIEQELKPFVDQIKLEPVEDNLNQTREEMIKKLKVIHDNSINEINALIKKYKQPNSTREESMKEAIQSAEKIFESQAKMSTNSCTNSPRLSTFFKLTHLNGFKSIKLTKYVEFVPELLHSLHLNNNKFTTIPINKNKFLSISKPDGKFQFQVHDYRTGFISSQIFDDNPRDLLSLNSIADTFSIVDEHVVTMRNYNVGVALDEFLSKFKPDRLETNVLVEQHFMKKSSMVSHIQLIDVFDASLRKISQATIKSSDKAFVYTCGNGGILIQSRVETNKKISHYFALYSLKMKLKRKRIRVDFDSTPIEFKPIKFDAEKCFIFKYNELEFSTSIQIYSFNDSSLLQQINISIPPQKSRYKTMAIDSENENLYFTSSISQTINCFNLPTNELINKSHIRGMDFSRLMLANDERLILSNEADRKIRFSLEDNFRYRVHE